MKNIVFKWSETNRMKTDCFLKDERDFLFKGTLVSNLHLHHCNRIHCPILSGINLLISWLPVMRWWTQWMMTDWKSGIAVSMPSSAIKIACSLIVLWFRFFKLFCALTLNASPNSASLEFHPNQGLRSANLNIILLWSLQQEEPTT